LESLSKTRVPPYRPQPRAGVTPDPNFAPDSLPTVAAINRSTAAPIRLDSLTATFLFKKNFFRSLRSLNATKQIGCDTVSVHRLVGLSVHRLVGLSVHRCIGSSA
jgi:hypothetical protein